MEKKNKKSESTIMPYKSLILIILAIVVGIFLFVMIRGIANAAFPK